MFALQSSSVVVNAIVSFIPPAEMHRSEEHVPGSAGQRLAPDGQRGQDVRDVDPPLLPADAAWDEADVWLNLNSPSEVDQLCEEWKRSGVDITDELETKPWNLREFTAQDLDGNRFRVFHDRGPRE
jgi:glyoxalase/bleomycin resistance protein/dioxygenase superfamily protein